MGNQETIITFLTGGGSIGGSGNRYADPGERGAALIQDNALNGVGFSILG